jgi:phosphate transport system permease protein
MIIGDARLKKIAAGQKSRERVFAIIAGAAVAFGLLALAVFLFDVLRDGVPRINWQFLTSFPSRRAAHAGILAALVGSVHLVVLTAAIAVPIGVGAAIYLEEYGADNKLSRFIELNIANLAGVPSIIYGLLGLELFVRTMQLGRSLIAGAMTMALLVLPIVIMASREALRAVPPSIRHASYALGATKWETVWNHVLPLALPGILTGVILALSRAIGEAAPLITIGALTYVAFLPESIKSAFSALPIQIFNWVSRPQAAFQENAAAGIVVLLVILLCLNGVAIWLRNKYQKRLQW